jgi:hypothetical protein
MREANKGQWVKLYKMRSWVMVSTCQESYRRVLGVMRRRICYVKFTQLTCAELVFKELLKVTRLVKFTL